MGIVVSVICFMLAFCAGVAAYITLSHDQRMKISEDHDESGMCALPDKMTVAAILEEIRSFTWKKWLLIVGVAFIAALAALRLYGMDLRLPAFARLLATAIHLIMVMIIDWKSMRIPNGIVLTYMAWGVLFLIIEYFWYSDLFATQLVTSVIGLLASLVLFYVLSKLTGSGIGMGDVKFLAAQGWMLGLSVTMISTIFSLLACSVFAVVLVLMKKKKMSDQIPFGPFMFVGFVISLLFCSF